MRLRTPAATLAGLALVLSPLSPPASAAGRSYVALGDSYASGTGARTYYRDGTSCQRSPRAYGSLVAAGYGLPLVLAACSGAVTDDVTARQLGSLTLATRYLTLTVGGNDLGFSSVFTECALPGWMSSCSDAVNGALRVLAEDLPGRLDRLLHRIGRRAPGAKVLVVGYPRLFQGTDCNAATFFSAAEQNRLNAATDKLNRLLSVKASATGAGFVNPTTSFSGHAWCSRDEWVNGLSRPVFNSYHPNADGHAAYARLVGPALVGRPLAVAGAGRPPAPAAVRLPSVATSRPFDVAVPDLSSARATRAAALAGITGSELARLRRAQEHGATNASRSG